MSNPDPVEEAVARILALPRGDTRHLVAIAGPPASGKSTLAALLCDAINNQGRAATVVPMDGFHYDNDVLKERGLLARKGAPNTFDLKGLEQLVIALQDLRAVTFPTFDRVADAAVPKGGHIDADCDIALVEGNYLLCNYDDWAALNDHWDLSITLNVPEVTLRQRLIQRWLDYGLDETAAVARAESNDLPNARTVLHTQRVGDIILSA